MNDPALRDAGAETQETDENPTPERSESEVVYHYLANGMRELSVAGWAGHA